MTKNPSSIEQMLIGIGPARNRAEQLLIAKIHQYAATERRMGVQQAHVEWVKALVTMTAIFTYRENGDKPPVEQTV